MMYLFTLIYDVLVYSQIIHSTNPNISMIEGEKAVFSQIKVQKNPNLNPDLTLTLTS